jgi:hypothetical protein
MALLRIHNFFRHLGWEWGWGEGPKPSLMYCVPQLKITKNKEIKISKGNNSLSLEEKYGLPIVQNSPRRAKVSSSLIDLISTILS